MTSGLIIEIAMWTVVVLVVPFAKWLHTTSVKANKNERDIDDFKKKVEKDLIKIDTTLEIVKTEVSTLDKKQVATETKLEAVLEVLKEIKQDIKYLLNGKNN